MDARRPWRGVNLGGWLLLEPGPSAPLAMGRCEWDFMETPRRQDALAVLQRHRQSFIQKQDFVAIKDMGLNAVRVPFGYWIVLGPGPGEPYEGPAMEYLDLAVQWAEECDLEVLLDLHGCPGGESGDAPCGRVNRQWDWTCWRQHETLRALELVARRFKGRRHVKGLAVCNEPSRHVPAQVLASFYDRAVRVIRSAGMLEATVVLPVFQRSLPEFAKTWEALSGGHENTCFDVHYYHCFEDEWNRKSLAEQLRAVEDHRAELASFPCVVGEWSLALGGRGRAALPAAQGMAIFAAQQLRAYEAASHGWFFWNWRDGHGVAWDYRSCFEQCLLTSDPLTLPHWDGYGQDPLARLLEPRRVAIRYGEAICLRSAAGRCVDVEGLKVSARWFDRGAWQSLLLCPAVGAGAAPGAPLRAGDHVRLLAHTGACVALTPHGKATCRGARSCDFVVKLKGHHGRPVLHMDEIYLQCRSSGRFLEVDGTKVAARSQQPGDAQTFVVERVAKEGLDWLMPEPRGVKRCFDEMSSSPELESPEAV